MVCDTQALTHHQTHKCCIYFPYINAILLRIKTKITSNEENEDSDGKVDGDGDGDDGRKKKKMQKK